MKLPRFLQIKRKYAKPEIKTHTPEPIGNKVARSPSGKGTYRTRFQIGKKKHTWFMRNILSQEQLEMIQKLRKLGVNAEKPVFEKTIGGNITVFYEHGETLHTVLKKLVDKKKKTQWKIVKKLALRQLAKELAKMHCEGIEHGHPHSHNLTWKRFRIGLIDFSKAIQRQINWSDANSTYSSFRDDYHYLGSRVLKFEFGMKLKEVREFFQKVVNNYPCTEQVKQKILEQITEDFQRAKY
ncbi:MAG: lipopolysaccharide kinase InaA family protein [Candidatus Diapherotrites archaeon]|nr:lipopolysaccharide kinase InaA family protein [Candidatus Diapherotrites archaeon]